MSIDLDAIQKRVDAATEGPWFFDAEKWLEGSARDGYYVASPGEYSTDEVQVLEIRDADAEFIAHARTDVPALLAYARDLEARVRRYAEQDADAFMKLQVTASQAKLRAKVVDLEARIERVEALAVASEPFKFHGGYTSSGIVLANDIFAALTATDTP